MRDHLDICQGCSQRVTKWFGMAVRHARVHCDNENSPTTSVHGNQLAERPLQCRFRHTDWMVVEVWGHPKKRWKYLSEAHST